MIAIGQCGSCGDLNSRLIQAKNRSVCENVVTGIWGSCRLLVMGSCPDEIVADEHFWFFTFVACWSTLSTPLAYLSASGSVSWDCSNFLLTLLDFPLSIIAISISVSNQPAGKSQCSPSALSFEMNESHVSSFPCLMQRNLCMLYSRF